MKRNIFLFVSIFILLQSCVNFRHEITDNKTAWFPYEIGKDYVLKEDVFLMQVDSGLESKRLALVPVSDEARSGGFYSTPKSINDYNKNPKEASRIHLEHGYFEIIVVAVIKAGTTFTPSRIMQNAGWDLWFGNHTFNTIYGKITNGEYKGEEVDILDISKFDKISELTNRYVKIK